MKMGNLKYYVFMVLVLIWIFAPIAWMVGTSLQTEKELHVVPPSYIPPKPTLGNFWFIFHVEEAMKQRLKETGTFFLPAIAKETVSSIKNSVIVAVSMIGLNLLLGGMAAHAFLRIKFYGSYNLLLFTICTRLIPPIAIIVPFFIIVKNLNLLDSLYALFLIHGAFTLPISIWILYGYLSTLPEDIEDAARIDGYSRLEILFRIVYPLITPGLVVVAIFSFMVSYSEFIFAFIITQTEKSHTIPVIIAAMGANPVMPKGILAAAGILAMIPPVVIFAIFRKYIQRGLVAGAIR